MPVGGRRTEIRIITSSLSAIAQEKPHLAAFGEARQGKVLVRLARPGDCPQGSDVKAGLLIHGCRIEKGPLSGGSGRGGVLLSPATP
jgi:hypothetical protein